MAGLPRVGAIFVAASVPVTGVALSPFAWRGIGSLASGAVDPDRVLATVIATGGVLAAAYLTATALPVLASLVGGAPDRTPPSSPRLWRTLLALTLGLGVSAATATTAAAYVSPGWGEGTEPSPQATPLLSATPSPTPLDAIEQPLSPQWGGTAPDAPAPTIAAPTIAASTIAAPTIAASTIAAPTIATPTHLVVRGDSLWRIAKSRLPQGASDTEITRAWQAIYWLNRATIGSDPGLIYPGQILNLPSEVAS
jgi:resuscitation-promoting factor RpfA